MTDSAEKLYYRIGEVEQLTRVPAYVLRYWESEFKLLRQLVRNAGRAYSRNELLDAVLGEEAFVVDRNVDVHVASLRKKLGPYGRHLLTIRGLGYKFREHPEAPD